VHIVTMTAKHKTLDEQPRIVLAIPDVFVLKKARRWLRGSAMLLADASNGCAMVERIAREAATVATMAEAAIIEYEEDSPQ
jgi:hypothetical protein